MKDARCILSARSLLSSRQWVVNVKINARNARARTYSFIIDRLVIRLVISIFLVSLCSRSSKAEKNADGLQEIEREVDRYKDILQNLNKRIAANVCAGQPQDAVAREKRCKKVPEFQLGQLMEESVKDLPIGLLKDVLDTCGKCSNRRSYYGPLFINVLSSVRLVGWSAGLNSTRREANSDGNREQRGKRGELCQQKP